MATHSSILAWNSSYNQPGKEKKKSSTGNSNWRRIDSLDFTLPLAEHIIRFSLKLSMLVCMRSLFSRVWLFVIPWTVAHQAPLSMGFSRQNYWSGLPFPPPGDLPKVKPPSLISPALPGWFFSTSITWEALSLSIDSWGKYWPLECQGSANKSLLMEERALSLILLFSSTLGGFCLAFFYTLTCWVIASSPPCLQPKNWQIGLRLWSKANRNK